MIVQLFDDQQPALILVLVFPLPLLPSLRTSPAHSPQGRVAPPLPSPAQPRILQRTAAAPDPIYHQSPAWIWWRNGRWLRNRGAHPTCCAGWDGLFVLTHQVAAAVKTAGPLFGGTGLGAHRIAVQKRKRS